jgi:hypothetical protein
VNAALQETITAGHFALEREATFDVVHRYADAAELLKDIKTWTGTSIPAALRRRLERSIPPFDVQEGARLKLLPVL